MVTKWNFEVFSHGYRMCLNSGINNFLVLILISVPFIKSYLMMPTLSIVYLPYNSLNFIYETIKPHIFLLKSKTMPWQKCINLTLWQCFCTVTSINSASNQEILINYALDICDLFGKIYTPGQNYLAWKEKRHKGNET